MDPNFELLCCVDVPDQPDCLAWCPNPGYTDILAVATYSMAPDPAQRLGQILLYRLQQHDLSCELSLKASIQCAGVFEITFLCPESASFHQPIIAASLSSGEFALFKLEMREAETETIYKLWKLTTISCATDGAMLLCHSMDTSRSNDLSVCCGDSKGALHNFVLPTSNQSASPEVTSWAAHRLPMTEDPAEVWAVSHHPSEPNVVYSGGDDALLKAWDLRMDPRFPTASSRSHGAGVTAIAQRPTTNLEPRKTPSSTHFPSSTNSDSTLGAPSHNPAHIWTGSYDESIRLFDCRSLKSPLGQWETGGGVWQLDWLPPRNSLHADWLLGAACMYNGFSVFKKSGDVIDGVAVGQTPGQEGALLYGFGWRTPGGLKQDEGYICAACTFYDKKLYLLSYKIC